MKTIGRLIMGILLIASCCSWGFFVHYKINHLAVFILPTQMKGFYENNIQFITEHAVSADKRRYVDSTEAPKHFLNADHFGKNPFKAIPRNYYDAAIKYTADTINKYGTLPWTIENNYYRLVKAFKQHDTAAILTISANLGHYIADAHVPLHLTENYNGQLTNQTGIHALWENRLPELFFNRYRLYVVQARYVENPLNEAFKICKASFKCVDSVLKFEQNIDKSFKSQDKYELVAHGKKKIKDYSTAYASAYNKLLNGMVERCMRSAILSIGSYWYSAWVDAGQPDLNKLIKSPLSKAEFRKLNKEQLYFKNKKG
jgi:hypothetical protein